MSRLLRAATRLCLVLLAATGSAFASAETGGTQAALQPALLDVTVNGQRGAEPILFLRGADGALYASAAAFSQWRMRLPPGEPVRHDGDLFYRITSLSFLNVEFSEEQQAVRIDAATASFATQRTSLATYEPTPISRPSTGAYLNYDLLAEHVGGKTQISGAAQLVLFTRHGVGEMTFVASAGSGPDRLTRLETSWSIDRPENATTIRIGDSTSSGGPGGPPVRFAGLQYYRNFSVQPGFITMPLPSGQGSAAVPSVVDVYVNNALQSSRDVAPGPFELTDIPVRTGGGTVQIVVRDVLGREVFTEQSYYASTQLLRRGLHDFSYEAGFVRRDFGRRSNRYGEFMASTTHRYGLSDRITVEGQAQASRSRQMAGAAFTMLAFDLGQVGGSGSVSRSDKGVGFRAAASFDRRTSGLSFGIRGEYSSAKYEFIGMSARLTTPRYTVQAFADVPLWRGAVGVNLLHRSLRGEPSETVASLFGSFQVTPAAAVSLFARRTVAGRRESLFGLHLALALGGRRSASASLEHDRRGFVGTIGFQSDPPSGTGGGFRANASFGGGRRLEAAYLHNLPMATLGAHVSHVKGTTGVRLSATGSIGLHGGKLFAARGLGEAFATVRLDGFPGVRVYSDDRLVGVTGRNGALVVPGLRPFDANRLRIEETDLPIDAQIATTEVTLRPYARTGTIVRFEARRERGVLMRVRREDGSPLPAGAAVRLPDGTNYVVASGGEIYAPNLSGAVPLRASWAGGACVFTAVVPENDDPQPRIDGLICRAEPVYAAN